MLRRTILATLFAALFCAAPAHANDFYARPALPTSNDQVATGNVRQTRPQPNSQLPASWRNAKIPGKIVKSTRPDGKRPAPASIQ